MSVRVLYLSLSLGLAAQVSGQVVHTPVLGEFEFSTLEVDCPAMPSGCYACINDDQTTADHRLMLALGGTSPNLSTTGLAEGVLRPYVEADGVRVTPDLFPCGAVLRSGIRWFDRLFPQSCNGAPVALTYEIGSAPEVTVSGDGDAEFLIPAENAMAIPFRFELCSEFVHWGAGCGIAGSSQYGFSLRLPAPLRAIEVTAGDSPAMPVPGGVLSVDFLSSPGGVVSLSRVYDDLPETLPSIPHLNGYWDVHTNMAPGSYTADIVFDLDAASFPPGVNPASVVVGIYDPVAGDWQALATQVDVDAGTATVRTDLLSKFVLVADATVRAERQSWSALKAGY